MCPDPLECPEIGPGGSDSARHFRINAPVCRQRRSIVHHGFPVPDVRFVPCAYPIVAAAAQDLCLARVQCKSVLQADIRDATHALLSNTAMCVHRSGHTPISAMRPASTETGSAKTCEHFCKTRAAVPSGPVALSTCSSFKTCSAHADAGVWKTSWREWAGGIAENSLN